MMNNIVYGLKNVNYPQLSWICKQCPPLPSLTFLPKTITTLYIGHHNKGKIFYCQQLKFNRLFVLIQFQFSLLIHYNYQSLQYNLTLKYTTNQTNYPNSSYSNIQKPYQFMNRIVTHLTKIITYHRPLNNLVIASMSGLKLRNNKKSSSTVFAELSSQYLQKYNQQQSKDKNIDKTNKQTQKGKIKNKQQGDQVVEIQQLKNSWLGGALQDDLLVQTKQWQGDSQIDFQTVTSDKNNTTGKFKQNTGQQNSQQVKKLFSHSKSNPQLELVPLKVKSFKKQLPKNQLINNSRKFLQIICNIFPRHQVQRIIAELKQFCQKRDLNIPSLISLNLQNQKSSGQKKSQQRKLQKEMKIIEKITKDREKKLFLGVRRIFDQSLTDLELIDSLLSLLSQSDPYIMNSEDIHKLIYNHEEGAFENEASHHKAEINVILDKKQRQSLLTQKDQQKAIDQLISSKTQFLKQADQFLSKPTKKQSLDEESQQDLINVFEEFSMEKQIKSPKSKIDSMLNKSELNENKLQKEKQKHQKKRQKSMKLIVKKNIHQLQEKIAVPEQFEINQHSLHQIERILFKNKKIVEDNIVFKKVKGKHLSNKIQKQRDEFGKNWIYAYEMPYALDHAGCQEFVDFISKNYGSITQYYIFPYKNMLEKRENIMIHIQNQKRLKAEAEQKEKGPINTKNKPQVADKLLQKIEKEKNLKLNKSSMVFKFDSYDQKLAFLLPQMRLYGLNYKTFRNVRFEEAQSKKIIAISMIPWGCSSEDLLKAINKALKPIQVQVSYQSCILAKGFIFIELDNFFECLNACQLLNNLQFQGHSLKVQINYGSCKIYGQQYKNALQFDHYETLVKKLKDIKCFYNEVYQD